VVDREAGRGRRGFCGGCVDGRLEVLHAAAAAADHVVVGVGARVVDGGAARGTDAAHEAELVEQLERRVDRRRRQARHPGRELAVDLLGREVASAAADVAVHQQPRCGHAVAAGAQGGRELVVEELVRDGRHAVQSSSLSSVSIICNYFK